MTDRLILYFLTEFVWPSSGVPSQPPIITIILATWHAAVAADRPTAGASNKLQQATSEIDEDTPPRRKMASQAQPEI